MYASDICKRYKDLVGHGNFPSTVYEMDIFLDLIRPNSPYEVVVTGAGTSTDDIIDDSDIVKLANKLGQGGINSDFQPKTELEQTFIDLVFKDYNIMQNLINLSLSDFFSEQEIIDFNKKDDWDFYHENVKVKTIESMDLLTRAGHELI